MSISRIEIFKAGLPLKRPFRIAIGETRVTETIFVRVHTDDGLYGLGEASLFRPVVGESRDAALANARDLAHLLIGRNPLDIDGCVCAMRAFLPNNATIRSAFDMALYDLLGKNARLPLHAVLAGAKRSFVTDNTVGIDTPETMAAHALEFRERGFTAVKVKLGTGVAEDVARVAAIRDVLGPETAIRIDANQGWDRVEALQALRQLSAFNIQYCEQPVAAWDFDGLSAARALGAIPIMADEALFDEHDAMRLVSAGACDYFNIKLAKSGGIHVALKINALAEAAGIKCMVGCMTETRLGLTAAAHLVSARANVVFADLDGADMLREDPVVGGMLYHAGGVITLPDTPGIGADLDAGFVAGLECETIGRNA
ncbi:mandelate racemase/muconate lactonizing enzyme family protein [uncultured Nitratireductor sp.]|uniref:mandelate racemase/muconate lactonizing enzyme family protein n=1 Tax=uncultured Nitratireductor sp. TaxID=520953 RepID=UPI0025D948DB|nr:dipeptide epimerase [uncultured Nitratireductor sp.]